MGHDHHHCSGVPCDICGPDPRDAEIARLKAELSEARRHAVGVMAAGFSRALDAAGAPVAESPGLRVHAMAAEITRLKAILHEYEEHHGVEKLIANCTAGQDAEIARLTAERDALRVTADEAIVEHLVARKEVERLRRALAAGPADLRWRGPMTGGEAATNVEAAQEAAMKEGT